MKTMIVVMASSCYAEPPPGMRLYCMNGGFVDADKSSFTAGRDVGKIINVPVPMYLIDHPKGLVLFDTGMNPKIAHDPEAHWGPTAQAIPPQMKPSEAADKQVQALGYKLEDVKFVALSHMHLDHAGGMTLFPNATFIVRKTELQTAWWPEPYQRPVYILEDYLASRGYNYMELDDTEDYDIFGDGSLILVDTKGHVQGHQSLIVNLPKSGMIILAADAAIMMENVDELVLPGIVWNPSLALDALEKLRLMREKYGAKVFTSHDPDVWQTIKQAPEYYD